jgi:hypothetical protein
MDTDFRTKKHSMLNIQHSTSVGDKLSPPRCVGNHLVWRLVCRFNGFIICVYLRPSVVEKKFIQHPENPSNSFAKICENPSKSHHRKPWSTVNFFWRPPDLPGSADRPAAGASGTACRGAGKSEALYRGYRSRWSLNPRLISITPPAFPEVDSWHSLCKVPAR